MVDSKRTSVFDGETNDYHIIPPTEKQMNFARSIAQRTGSILPYEITKDRSSLSRWIDQHKNQLRSSNRFDQYPSSKQVGFAESLARRRRTEVPHECFKNKKLMSNWINSNIA